MKSKKSVYDKWASMKLNFGINCSVYFDKKKTI